MKRSNNANKRPLILFLALVCASTISYVYLYRHAPFSFNSELLSGLAGIDQFPAREVSFADYIVDAIRFVFRIIG